MQSIEGFDCFISISYYVCLRLPGWVLIAYPFNQELKLVSVRTDARNGCQASERRSDSYGTHLRPSGVFSDSTAGGEHVLNTQVSTKASELTCGRRTRLEYTRGRKCSPSAGDSTTIT